MASNEATVPAWRSFPFYESIQLAAKWTAGHEPRDVHSIQSLGGIPPGVQLDVGNASSSASAQRPGSDSPFLLVLKSGDFQILHPATLQPITTTFASLPSSGIVTHAEYDAQSARLAVWSEDGRGGPSTAAFPLLRIWQISVNVASLPSRKAVLAESEQRWRWAPRLLAEARVQHGRKPFPISAVAVTAGMTYLACSLANGAVLLLRNLAAALDDAPIPTVTNAASPAVVLPKFKVVYQPGNASSSSNAMPADQQDPVTALGFSQASHSSKTLSLFIATLSRVIKYTVLGKGAGSTPATLDDIGAPLGCAVLLPASALPSRTTTATAAAAAEPTSSSHTLGSLEAKLLIARSEALYIIGSNGREDCFAYEGNKASVTHLPASNQLVILSPPITQQQDEVTKVSIFDLRGKFLSYTGHLKGAITAIFSDSTATSSAALQREQLHAAVASPSTTMGREDVFVLTSSSSLHRLQEQPLRTKLDLLFNRGLFVLASQVAKSHFASSSAAAAAPPDDSTARLNTLLADVWIKYGDYLYEKGDYEGSMKSGYLKSVAAASNAKRGSRRRGTSHSHGHRPSQGGMGQSYIIRKFLDAQRIPLLTLYLQELHKRGLANSDHTTLLLNCYTKMKNTEALDRFIRRSHVSAKRRSATSVDGTDLYDDDDDDDDDDDSDHSEQDNGGSDLDAHADATTRDRLPFDLSTAIKVCRSAGYHSQAAYLAKKFNMGDEYLRIKIEDTQEPLEALDWLRGREADEVVRYVNQYAAALIASGDDAERETTDLLIELCSGAYRPRVVNSVKALEQAARAAAAVKNKKGYEIPNGVDAAAAADSSQEQQRQSQQRDQDYYVPAARQFFPHFMRFPQSFVRFLETVALARWGQAIDERDVQQDAELRVVDEDEEDDPRDGQDEDEELNEQRDIWNTFLEMLLRRSGADGTHVSNGDGHGDRSRHRALLLLKQHDSLPYDVHHALVLCEQAQLTEGVVFLYERLGMYEDILRLWMDEARAELRGNSNAAQSSSLTAPRASQHVLTALDRYAAADPSLYSLTLRFLISHPILLSSHRTAITSILTRISDLRLMSTLEIIQLLSKTPNANVGLIKSFLEDSVTEEQAEIQADQALIESYRSETLKKENEIRELNDPLQGRTTFQSNTCNACGGQLDLPAVHFMCKHSYHQRCLRGGGGGARQGGNVDDDEDEKAQDASAASAVVECPACLRSYGVVREIRRNNADVAKRHDLFLQELSEADDPFATIASMFSRGVFSRQALE